MPTNTRPRRLVNGAAKEMQERFGLKSSMMIWRVMASGGLGLGIGTTAARLYEYMWDHRNEIFTADYYSTFIHNDKTHRS